MAFQSSASSIRIGKHYLSRRNSLTLFAQTVVVQSHGKSLTVRLCRYYSDFYSGKALNCEIHTCARRCHRLQDHSKVQCRSIITSKCSKGHKLFRKCYEISAASCRRCEADAGAQEKRRQREQELDEERQANQQVYAARLAEIEDEIRHQNRQLSDRIDKQDRQTALAQKKQDLLNLKRKAQSLLDVPMPSNSTKKPTMVPQKSVISDRMSIVSQTSAASSDGNELGSNEITAEQSQGRLDWEKSEAKDDWEDQKERWGAANEALDTLMSMTGKDIAHHYPYLLTI
jgi:hypothetical protein